MDLAKSLVSATLASFAVSSTAFAAEDWLNDSVGHPWVHVAITKASGDQPVTAFYVQSEGFKPTKAQWVDFRLLEVVFEKSATGPFPVAPQVRVGIAYGCENGKGRYVLFKGAVQRDGQWSREGATVADRILVEACKGSLTP